MSTMNTKRSPNSSKTKLKNQSFRLKKQAGGISEYVLKANGLRLLYCRRPYTGVVTANIVYNVGSRDESLGRTGMAHMLEHLLFMPTTSDKKQRRQASGAMRFEREVGVNLNANTWRDRTAYYFSMPKEYLGRALSIEADRMREVVVDKAVFEPERRNVLSEFDMYNGDPYFALSCALSAAAFHSHPYHHETIGWREDIAAYTVEGINDFYNTFYRPDNAVLIIVGDVTEAEALAATAETFGRLSSPATALVRRVVSEPVQEGLRRTEVARPSSTSVLGIAFKHPGFPSVGWFETLLLARILADGEDSLLYGKLVETGLASAVACDPEPAADTNIAVLYITLSKKATSEKLEKQTLNLIGALDKKEITRRLPALKMKLLRKERFKRDSSLAMVGELTEYVATGDWAAYNQVEAIIAAITPTDILTRKEVSFQNSNLTIGNFIGTRS